MKLKVYLKAVFANRDIGSYLYPIDNIQTNDKRQTHDRLGIRQSTSLSRLKSV